MSDEVPLPKWGCVLLVVPILAIGGVMGAYGWLALNVLRGTPAAGPRVTLPFVGCPAAADAVLARVERMGLQQPVVTPTADGFTMEVDGPPDPKIASKLGPTLVRPGRVELVGPDGTVTAWQGAFIRLDLRMVPSTVFTLLPGDVDRVAAWQRAAPEGDLVVRMDGAEIGRIENRTPTGSEVSIEPPDSETEAGMHEAAARSVAAAFPLPCELRLR